MTSQAGFDYRPRDYPPFAVTVDVAIFTIRRDVLHVLLIERGGEPFLGARALPGGFVRVDEDLDQAASRELAEETGLREGARHLEQLAAYGGPGRDPRMRVVTVAYWAICADLPTVRGGGDATAAMLTPVEEIEQGRVRLAFDHERIVRDAVERTRSSLEYTTLAARFCPPEFTIGQLRRVYETVWNTPLDAGNFQRNVRASGAFEERARMPPSARGRPASRWTVVGEQPAGPLMRALARRPPGRSRPPREPAAGGDVGRPPRTIQSRPVEGPAPSPADAAPLVERPVLAGDGIERPALPLAPARRRGARGPRSPAASAAPLPGRVGDGKIRAAGPRAEGSRAVAAADGGHVVESAGPRAEGSRAVAAAPTEAGASGDSARRGAEKATAEVTRNTPRRSPSAVTGTGGAEKATAAVTRNGYLRDPAVERFVEWLRPRVRGDVPFSHEYWMLKSRRRWRCDSLRDAFENYEWRGRGFAANQETLERFAADLRRAARDDDRDGFVEAAVAVLRWGGVTGRNERTLRDLGGAALPEFLADRRLLDPSRADTSKLDGVRRMNSGWTKVHALLLDNFPMYDGRVGAALGCLVRLHCADAGLTRVPELLRFGYPPGRGQHNRNPSAGPLRFPMLSAVSPRRWSQCNVRAAWVLAAVAGEGPFGELPPRRRLRALEAALFMIGYELPAPE